MAQRFKAEQLQEMIRALVRQEIKEVVAETINEVLSTRYLKELAESTLNARPRGVASLPIQGDDEVEEEVPQVLSNDILGVGEENERYVKEPKKDHVRQHNESLDREGILNLFFEGTKPLKQLEEQAEVGVSIDVEKPEVAETAERWKDVLAQANQLAEQRRPAAPVRDAAAEEARLKRLREQLDVPASQVGA